MSKKLLASALCVYIGTKSVLATTMTRGEYNDYRGWTIPENEDPHDAGYLIEDRAGQKNTEQLDGYVQWLPASEFDRTYRQNGSLTFGDAIIALKQGQKVARSGWNGKGMFLYFVPENKYPAARNTLQTLEGLFEDNMVPYGAYIAMKTAQDNVVPWLASQTDVLAEDWVIL